jgi:hypothetical protein
MWFSVRIALVIIDEADRLKATGVEPRGTATTATVRARITSVCPATRIKSTTTT